MTDATNINSFEPIVECHSALPQKIRETCRIFRAFRYPRSLPRMC